MIESVAATPFDRILAPAVDCLTPEVARKLLAVRIDASVQRRLDELGRKANFGTQTEAEREEHESLINGVEMLAILKAYVRHYLSRSEAQ